MTCLKQRIGSQVTESTRGTECGKSSKVVAGSLFNGYLQQKVGNINFSIASISFKVGRSYPKPKPLMHHCFHRVEVDKKSTHSLLVP
jgi:hypothetical protein